MPSGDTFVSPPPAKPVRTPGPRLGVLFRRRMCVLPTWRGWILLFVMVVALFVAVARQLCAFLSPNQSVPGGVLVVEGWVPAYAAKATLEEFRRHPYLGIYATGEPMEEGNPYIGYHDYAEFTAERLKLAGAPADQIHTVPAPFVGKDRTYTTAEVLKKRLESEGVSTAKVNLVTLGPHARRSRLLYERAFGPGSQIGIISIPDQEFDAAHWWRSSSGFRTVVSEAIAFLYARFVFRSPNN